MATAQVELKDQLQNGTSATLTNQTMADMQLIRYHSWSGSFLGIINSPPTAIPRGGVARFEHLSAHNCGSKAAVSYTITTPLTVLTAVILAWDAPTNFNPAITPNKVYGAVGPRGLIDSMSWDQIEKLLDTAGSSVEIKDGLQATILNNPTTKMADLLAIFSSGFKP